MQHKRSLYLFIFVFICLAGISDLSAQNNTKSPYSRFGIGDLAPAGFSSQSGMGRIGQGLRRDRYINIQNPASYSALALTVFETGGFFERGTVENSSRSQPFRNASFGYLSLGIPVMKKIGWGAAFGLQPVSYSGYNIVNNQTLSNGIPVQSRYEGRGGLSKFYIGNGVRLFKDSGYVKNKSGDTTDRFVQHSLSFGFNVNYVYGHLKTSKLALFDDPTSSMNNFLEERTRYIGDLTYDVGIQYQTRLNKFQKLTIGASYIPARNMRGSQVVFARNLIPGQTDMTKDTVEFIDNPTPGTLNMPDAWAFGLVWQGSGKDSKGNIKQNEWLLGLDVQAQNWNNYSMFGTQDSLGNSISVSLGGMFLPLNDISGGKRKLKKVEYRAGVRYARTNLQIRGEAIKEYGVSLGMGIPIRVKRVKLNEVNTTTFTRINLSAEYYRRGTIANNLLREDYLRFTLGITFEDVWFDRGASKFR